MTLRAAIVTGLICVASTAGAEGPQQTPSQRDLDDLKGIEDLTKLAGRLFDEKNYNGALAVYKEAYRRFPNAKILVNIGITLNKLERYAEAANALQLYVTDPSADPKLKPDFEKAIAAIDKTVGILELEITPPDAQIKVNNGDWITTKRYRVAPGSVTLNGKKDGYLEETKTLSLAAGERQTVTLSLSQRPPDVIYVNNGVKADGPRSRFGAYAMEHLDIPHSGAATLIGVTFDVLDRVRVEGAAILGPNYGGYAGATLSILTGKFRPIVAAGMPIFFSKGARYGMRGAGGLELQINRHLALVAELGVEFMVINPEDDIQELVFIPAVGAMGRL